MDLTPRARRQALGRLPAGAAERRRFLAENQPDADDLFGQMLQAALGLKPPATRRSAARSQPTAESEQQHVAQDIAMLQAVQALQEAGVKLPGANSSSTVFKLRRSITLATRRQAARDLLPEPFRGRAQERKFLIDFAGRGAPAVEAARARPFKTLWLAEPGKPDPQFPRLVSAVSAGPASRRFCRRYRSSFRSATTSR
ncbi:hypothetical protein AJ88_15580 [Mesorhizobium amorphae CCBAU 01583]|nr:hypothetical protein AJ88_15580 [Mesorhizobium amorphae CCBAU 01583]